jgi:hypothetical protein
MWTPRPEYLGLSEMMAQSLSVKAIQKVQHCLNTKLALGTADFRDPVKALRS